MTPPRCWTATELLAHEHPEPVYVVENLLPVGLTALAGRPKSGKSRAALDLAVRIATGGCFLGYECKAGPVIYYALEDGPRRLARRLHALGGASTDSLRVYFETPDDLVAAIEGHFATDNALLVIVDTVGRAWSFDHNEMEKVYEVYAPLQALATRYERGLVVIDHLRKGRGEITSVEDVSGSTGKSATADNIWLLDRPPRKKTATLDIISRDLDEDLSLALEPGEGGAWKCVGSADTVRRTEGRQKILDAASRVAEAGEPITVTSVAAQTGVDPGHVSRTLSELVQMGDLVRLPKVGNVQPYSMRNAVNVGNKVNNGTEELTELTLLTALDSKDEEVRV
jgi:hypothetical protein